MYISHVIHELSTPLTVFLNSISLFVSEINELPSPDRKRQTILPSPRDEGSTLQTSDDTFMVSVQPVHLVRDDEIIILKAYRHLPLRVYQLQLQGML